MRTIQKLLTGLLDITCCTSLYTSGSMVMAARNPPPPAPHKQDPDSDMIKVPRCFMCAYHEGDDQSF